MGIYYSRSWQIIQPVSYSARKNPVSKKAAALSKYIQDIAYHKDSNQLYPVLFYLMRQPLEALSESHRTLGKTSLFGLHFLKYTFQLRINTAEYLIPFFI